MNRFIVASLIALVAAGPAQALSCMRPDAARAFQEYAAADETYSVLMGTFDFTAPPPQEFSNDAVGQSVTARFTGQGLAADGFGRVAPMDVTLETLCFGPWCGGFPRSGENVLAFVEHTPDGYVARLGPCGGTLFDVQTASVVASCMRGNTCDATPDF